MDSRVARYLLLSQVSFFAFIGICIAILPKFLFEHNEGGLSNYGVHPSTVVPFSLAFILCCVFLIQAARLVPIIYNHFRLSLLALASISLLVLITTYPYKMNAVFNNLHIDTAILIVCYQMLTGFWMALLVCKDRLNAIALGCQIVGFLLAALTFLGRVHLLFAAQLLTGLAFGVILVRTGRALSVNNDNKPLNNI